jgi:hypothetical protein
MKVREETIMCIGWLKKKNVKKEAVSPQETTEKETSQSSPEERVFTFDKLPESLAEFQFLPQANLASPYQTTALTVVALATYRKNPELCFSLIGFLQGPKALTPYGRAFIKDWLMGKDYKPYSYFKGATPPRTAMLPCFPMRSRSPQVLIPTLRKAIRPCFCNPREPIALGWFA